MYRRQQKFVKVKFVESAMEKISAKKFWQGLLTSPSFVVYGTVMCACTHNGLAL